MRSCGHLMYCFHSKEFGCCFKILEAFWVSGSDLLMWCLFLNEGNLSLHINLVRLRILKQVWFSFAEKKDSGLDATVMVLESSKHCSTDAVLVFGMKPITDEDSLLCSRWKSQTQKDFILNPLICVLISKKLSVFWPCNLFSYTKTWKANAACIFLYCCNFLSLFPPLLLSEINLKVIWYVNSVLYIQRWSMGNPKSYFKPRMFTRPDISFLENQRVWNREAAEGTRMLGWLLCRLGSELGKVCLDDGIRQIPVTMGLISSFLFCWTLADIGHSVWSRYCHASLRASLSGGIRREWGGESKLRSSE